MRLEIVDVYAAISADSYTIPLILKALDRAAPHLKLIHIKDHPITIPNLLDPLLQIMPYEELDFEHHLAHPKTSLANSYIIRKALIRKNHLWHTVSSWWSKHPNDAALRNHVPLTVTFELDYAEFLDDALVECFELHESFAKDEREWWVLKPAMSDQGHGVRLFSSFEELQAIFEEWEPSTTSDGEDEDDEGEMQGSLQTTETDGAKEHRIDDDGGTMMTSQLRHFIAQRYINSPLLFPEYGNRKFHIRSYVLAVGSLKVYVYKDMLALFAPESYHSLPNSDASTEGEGVEAKDILNARIHLTNTCLHTDAHTHIHASNNTTENRKDRANATNPPEATSTATAPVIQFWNLPSLPASSSSSSSSSKTTQTQTTDTTQTPTQKSQWHNSAFSQICLATRTLFEAAAREQMIHFQTLPNSFEVFGVDWLVEDCRPRHRPCCSSNGNSEFDGSGRNTNEVDDVNDVSVWLLEVNAFPDFKQTGKEGMEEVVGGFWEGVVRCAVGPFFGGGGVGSGKGQDGEDKMMVKVLDIDLGRR